MPRQPRLREQEPDIQVISSLSSHEPGAALAACARHGFRLLMFPAAQLYLRTWPLKVPSDQNSEGIRSARRRRATGRDLSFSTSMPTESSSGCVELARPPPRTALPGSRSEGKIRSSCFCQYASSSLAIVAICASCTTTCGLYSDKTGSRL